MKEMDVNGYWYKTTLGELVSAKGGYGFPRELQGRKRGQVAFFKVSDMSRSGNEKWLRAANNYIDNNDMNLLKAKVFPAESVVFPKIGAAIRTNKKRILAQPSVVDNNVMVLTVKQEQILEPIFLYYWMHTVDICDWANNGALPSIPASRVNSIRMSLPPSYEQKKIAAVLSTVQRAIEAQDRIIATTTELKKALMQKLFTEGLHGEPQKQTEIGPVPESWEVVELKHLLYQLDYGTSEKCTYQSDGPPVLRIPNVLSGEIDTKDLKYGPLKLVSSEGLYLKAGDLLFVRTNGVRENAGRCAEYEQSELGAQFASYLIRARVDQQQIEPRFVMEYTRTLKGRSYLSGRAVRTADGKFNVNKGIIETVPVPVPSVGDQKRIVHLARTLDERTRQAREKHIVLAELFNTLLHQLMTAQVRVNDIDLSFLDDLSTDDTARREEAG